MPRIKYQNLFWCDGGYRSDYIIFGDVIAFDSTYRTNTYKGRGQTVRTCKSMPRGATWVNDSISHTTEVFYDNNVLVGEPDVTSTPWPQAMWSQVGDNMAFNNTDIEPS